MKTIRLAPAPARALKWVMKFAISLAMLVPPVAQAAVVTDGDFRMQQLAAGDWRMSYCYSQPVEAIRFERPVAGFRESHWRPTDAAAFELNVDDSGAAELRRRDGKTFSCAAIDVRTWTELPEKNYYAFSPFSDGGMSVYTGYYTGPVQRAGEWTEVQLAAEYLGREDERVVTREPDRLVHQFVHFGRQDVTRTGSLIAVIDPAMPVEARQAILDTVPVVNGMLADTFGFRPDEPYLIFMATDLDAFDGYSVKGGALPGQILFTLKGRGVVKMLVQDPLHYPKTAAHEILHLWQNDHWFETLGNDQPWVHEGSADALAIEIMRRTGIYDNERYEQAWRETEAACVEKLRHDSIHAGPASGHFDIAYSCGALVNRLVGEMLEPADPGAGIIRFWQAMAVWPAEDRKGESEELFFRTLESLGIDNDRRGALKEFLDVQDDQPEPLLAEFRQRLMSQDDD